MNAATIRPKQFWTDLARNISGDARPFIEGKIVDPLAPATFSNINPTTGRAQGAVSDCGLEDVDRAVRSARHSFEAGHWRRMPPKEKKRILRDLCAAVRRNSEGLALLDTLDMGMPISQSISSIEFGLDYLEFYSEAIDKLTADVFPTSPAIHSFTIRRPRGVVGAIVAWNFPIVNALVKIGPALATGNSLVLKPSEVSPRSAIAIAEIAHEVGVPPGVFNVVPGSGSNAGQALARHPLVDMLTFVGSTATGARLMHYNADQHFKALLLECGGKSPTIVFPDVQNLEAEAQRVAQRITLNQGQVCVAGSRLIVHRDIALDLVSLVTAKLAAISPGDPLDPATVYGPMAFEAQRDKVLRAIAEAEQSGAKINLRGGAPEYFGEGFYVTPSVISQVDPFSDVWQSEIFGPVLAVSTFCDTDEAIRLANGTRYGLSAHVSSRDPNVIQDMVQNLKVGQLRINANSLSAMESSLCVSHEPVGASGFGVDLGLSGMASYMQLGSVEIDFGS